MKKFTPILAIILTLGMHFESFSQTGPGGVGSSSNLETWVNASHLSLSNNDLVTSWTDFSGNVNNADQVDVSKQPVFLTNQINGLPAVSFDGVNDYLDFSSSITATATTIFTVVRPTSSDYRSILAIDNHHISYGRSTIRAEFPTGALKASKSQSFSISQMYTDSESISATSVSLTNGGTPFNRTRTGFYNLTNNSIGSLFYTGSNKFFFQGEMAEIIVFNEELNLARRNIISNYLAAKYNLNTSPNLYSFKATHGEEVIGVGQEVDGSHTLSRGLDSIQISNPSSLNNGDYLIIGSDGGSYAVSGDVGSLVSQRWTRTWRPDITGTPGTVDITFYLGNNDFAVDPNEYALYIENGDGIFSNGATSIHQTGMAYDALNKTVTFTGVPLTNGSYFTLAELSSSPPPPPSDPISFGPGGVGTTGNIDIWVKADELPLSNSDPVTSWVDASGNENDANQAIVADQPSFLTNQINGLPAVSFDGINDRLDFTSAVTATATTIFNVVRPTTSNYKSILAIDNHHISYGEGTIRSEFPTGSLQGTKSQTFSISSTYTGSETVNPTSAGLTSGSTQFSRSRTGFFNVGNNSVGSLFFNGSFQYNFQGLMAEIIVFNEELNSAKRKIVSNYLAAKYNLIAEQNLYVHKTTHGNDVIGIGQEADGSHLESRGTDSLKISNASTLGNGDYILVGNDGAAFTTSTSVGSDATQRWTKVWRADITRTPGTVDLVFYLGSNDFATDPNNYAVLIENVDGDFGNGGTSVQETGRVYNALTKTLTFTGITLNDGDYFTLAEKNNAVIAIADGDWENTSTWACGCIPSSTDDVTIPSPFNVSINDLADAKSVSISSGGKLTFVRNDTIQIREAFIIDGTLVSGTGTATVSANGSSSQTFTNSSGSNVSFNNLLVNNSNGLDLIGGWSLTNNLQVQTGTLDVSGADSMVLVSDASGTAQILESAGAFTGNFTLQRFISTRNADFANLSAPTTNATIASLYDDITMSGVGGPNGDITAQGGGTFFSAYSYSRPYAQNRMTSMTDNLSPGVGYSIFLMSTISTFNASTIDFIGTPNSGNITPPVIEQGFNLVGNPYQSFIAFDNLEQTNILPTYYIFDTDAGTYATFGSGTNIAPGQGFWVEKTTAGSEAFNFEESDKISSTSSTFVRRKRDLEFKLQLTNEMDFFRNGVQISFDYSATEGKDQFDAPYLPSPIEGASELYSKTVYDDKLINNTLNKAEESHLIPLELKAGNTGTYNIEAKNINSILENYSCVYLNDKETGKRVDLSLNPYYSFETSTGISDRFDLVVSNSFEACEAKMNETVIQKVNSEINLRESYGNWYLDYNLGELSNQRFKISVYGLNGQLVVPESEINLSENGTYRLQNLNDLEGIFVIQIIGQEKVINKTIKL